MLRLDDIPELRARYNSDEALRNAINAHAEGLPLEGRYDHISKKDMDFEKATGIISELGTKVGNVDDPDPAEVALAMETCRKVFEANAFLYFIDPQSNWSKGRFAIDSGIYQGDENGDGKIDGETEGYGRVHDGNYYKQTIAHNCMLVYDSDEQVIWHSRRDNNGGQRWPNLGREPDDLEVIQTQGYTSGEVLAHAIGPDLQTPEFTHIKGDLTQAYTSKVSAYQRSFVFLNLGQSTVPAVLLVYDWMNTSDPGFDKYWLCHAMQEPVLSPDGKQFTINRLGVVGKYGIYSGKLVTSMILPEAERRIVEMVGGPGREFEGLGGVNYPTRPLESIQTEEP